MLWDFELLYNNISIQNRKHVLRRNSSFLKLEARNKS